ncbi:cell surface glycoprotein 1-like [Megalops cyprinoides]|uniref:cell surface glycoprotein 1-like n=1 Tax=Megalops cyprinoides TaxID=118141 RepID=UPI001864F28C|nr:cell surface glycoprotein 1-like [Megalops cyprinoides]
MGFAEDELFNGYLRRNMAKIATVVKVREILPHLPCLSQSDQVEVTAKRENTGNFNAMQLLLGRLRRSESWLEEFINGLRACQHTALADEIQAEYKSLKAQPGGIAAVGSSPQPPLKPSPTATSEAAETPAVATPPFLEAASSEGASGSQTSPPHTVAQTQNLPDQPAASSQIPPSEEHASTPSNFPVAPTVHTSIPEVPPPFLQMSPVKPPVQDTNPPDTKLNTNGQKPEVISIPAVSKEVLPDDQHTGPTVSPPSPTKEVAGALASTTILDSVDGPSPSFSVGGVLAEEEGLHNKPGMLTCIHSVQVHRPFDSPSVFPAIPEEEPYSVESTCPDISSTASGHSSESVTHGNVESLAENVAPGDLKGLEPREPCNIMPDNRECVAVDDVESVAESHVPGDLEGAAPHDGESIAPDNKDSGVPGDLEVVVESVTLGSLEDVAPSNAERVVPTNMECVATNDAGILGLDKKESFGPSDHAAVVFSDGENLVPDNMENVVPGNLEGVAEFAALNNTMSVGPHNKENIAPGDVESAAESICSGDVESVAPSDAEGVVPAKTENVPTNDAGSLGLDDKGNTALSNVESVAPGNLEGAAPSEAQKEEEPDKKESFGPSDHEAVVLSDGENIVPDNMENVAPGNLEGVSEFAALSHTMSVGPHNKENIAPGDVESAAESICSGDVEGVAPSDAEGVVPANTEGVATNDAWSLGLDDKGNTAPSNMESVAPGDLEEVAPSEAEKVGPDDKESIAPGDVESIVPENKDSFSTSNAKSLVGNCTENIGLDNVETAALGDPESKAHIKMEENHHGHTHISPSSITTHTHSPESMLPGTLTPGIKNTAAETPDSVAPANVEHTATTSDSKTIVPTDPPQDNLEDKEYDTNNLGISPPSVPFPNPSSESFTPGELSNITPEEAYSGGQAYSGEETDIIAPGEAYSGGQAYSGEETDIIAPGEAYSGGQAYTGGEEDSRGETDTRSPGKEDTIVPSDTEQPHTGLKESQYESTHQKISLPSASFSSHIPKSVDPANDKNAAPNDMESAGLDDQENITGGMILPHNGPEENQCNSTHLEISLPSFNFSNHSPESVSPGNIEGITPENTEPIHIDPKRNHCSSTHLEISSTLSSNHSAERVTPSYLGSAPTSDTKPPSKEAAENHFNPVHLDKSTTSALLSTHKLDDVAPGDVESHPNKHGANHSASACQTITDDKDVPEKICMSEDSGDQNRVEQALCATGKTPGGTLTDKHHPLEAVPEQDQPNSQGQQGKYYIPAAAVAGVAAVAMLWQLRK